MTLKNPGLLRFKEAYFERIWGGGRLQSVLHKATPAGKCIGEAWVVADHPEHESVVSDGPLEGRTLRELLQEDEAMILGTRAELTVHGRFPLLLKILDSAEALSVQVHPSDEDAARLGEPDVGKTEMWHVLDAAPGSELICGVSPEVTPEQFAAAIPDGSVEELMTRFPAPAGTSAFVSAGAVHAIGGGILLAEIQQNSNITYRIYDWGRVDAQGRARDLHVDKAMEVIRFGSAHRGAAHPLSYEVYGASHTLLGACRYFAAESIQIEGKYTRNLSGETFYLLMVKQGPLAVCSGETSYVLQAGETVMVPGVSKAFEVEGVGELLAYYVPDLMRDIVTPLRAAGHTEDEIIALGGAPDESDLTDLC